MEILIIVLPFVGGFLLGRGAVRGDNRYVAAGMILLITAMALVVV